MEIGGAVFVLKIAPLFLYVFKRPLFAELFPFFDINFIIS